MPRSRLTVVSSKTASSQLKERTATACLIAKDAVANLLEFMEQSSRMAYLTVKDCERELDKVERDLDEQLPSAITRVGERKARELIACLRFTTDLERIGDLVWWVAQRIHEKRPAFSRSDANAMNSMAEILISMLQDVHTGFVTGDATLGQSVIARDRDIDSLRKTIFTEQIDAKRSTPERVEILFIAQALERAGDHATNLAEELIHLYEGRSVRHLPKKITEM